MRDEHVSEKFARLAEPVIGEVRSTEALARWWHMRDAPDLRALIELVGINP